MSSEALPPSPELPPSLDVEWQNSRVNIINPAHIGAYSGDYSYILGGPYGGFRTGNRPNEGNPIETILVTAGSHMYTGDRVSPWEALLKLNSAVSQHYKKILFESILLGSDETDIDHDAVQADRIDENTLLLGVDGHQFVTQIYDYPVVRISNYNLPNSKLAYVAKNPPGQTEEIAEATAFAKTFLHVASYCDSLEPFTKSQQEEERAKSFLQNLPGHSPKWLKNLDKPYKTVAPNHKPRTYVFEIPQPVELEPQQPQIKDTDRGKRDVGEREHIAGRKYAGKPNPPLATEQPPTRDINEDKPWGQASGSDEIKYLPPKRILNAIDEVVPQYKLDDIGGMEDIKQQVKEIADAFESPELMEKWMVKRAKGVLFYGEPGTGKTMLAHAIAHETQSTLWVVDSASLYESLMGNSSKNIQEIFDSVSAFNGRLVVFFDELDSIIGIQNNPGSGGADAERNQVAGIFKQRLNTLTDQKPDVIIVAATNDLDRIDPALRRSGRFDSTIEVPMPDSEGRKQIIAKILSEYIMKSEASSFLLGEDLNVPELARATEGRSGSDINEIIARVARKKAMYEKRTGKIQPITQADILTSADLY